jgi:ferredoxin-NADP reductase
MEGPAPVIVAKIASRWQSSADGKIDLFEIVSRDGSDLPAFTAGGHIDITVTPEYIRQFSLAGNPADRSRYLVGVLREDSGRGGSRKIHQMLRPGVPVVVSRPRNHFPVAPNARRHVLLAGGIGVTPLIVHEPHRGGADFTLYYKARTRAQAAFIPELERVLGAVASNSSLAMSGA